MADLSDGAKWSETDGANNLASPNGWPEGMMPSGVNDSARNDKGALKRFWDKINPVYPVTPTGGVWNFPVANPAYPVGYVSGEVYSFRPTASSAGGDQFQVNALGAKPIFKRDLAIGFVPIAAYDIVSEKPVQLAYNSVLDGGSGGFILLNPFVPVTGDGTGGTSLGTTTITGALSVSSGVVAGSLTTGGAVTAGSVNSSGPIITSGPSSILQFDDRDGVSQPWGWYADAGLARLNLSGTGNLVSVNSAGNLVAAGTVTGTAFIGNVTVPAGGTLSTTGTVTGGQVTSTGNINASGNITASSDLIAGNNITAGNKIFTQHLEVDQDAFIGVLTIDNGLQVSNGVCFNQSGSWTSLSDATLKDDIAPYRRGLDAVLALNPVSFRYRPEVFGDASAQITHFGLMADEVAPLVPEMVGETMHGGRAVSTLTPGHLVWCLINAAKDLEAQNTALAARVAALEADAARG